MKVPMLDLSAEYRHMKMDIDAAIARCLEHQRWILGPEVKELESAVASFLGDGRCVGVSSGTEALVLALRALAIARKGREYFDRSDKIVTTPFTFTATGDAILRSGATPVFVDIDPETFNISIRELERCLAQTDGVVGIVPVHLYGAACDMDAILGLAKQRKLFVVEDVAQAFGGTYKGKKLGTLGDFGAFSFFPSKNLGGFGDGGMVSAGSAELAELVSVLLKHGGKNKYDVEHIGYNARLDTLQAAVLVAKLKYIDAFNQGRRRVARLYQAGLGKLTGIVLPQIGTGHVVHQYTVRVLNGKREALQKKMAERGVDTMVYYPVPLNKMKVFSGRSISFGTLEVSAQASLEVLSLPVEPLMSDAAAAQVVGSLQELTA